MKKQQIILNGEQTGKERHLLLNPLVESKQLLKIIEIGKNDLNNYPELIGVEGYFETHPAYGTLFRLKDKVIITIGESQQGFTDFYFADVTMEIVK